MPLRDALSLSNDRSDDPAPITAELINNTANILAATNPIPTPTTSVPCSQASSTP